MTKRQLEIMTIIGDANAATGVGPTHQEIADHFGVSKVTIFEQVESLRKHGLVAEKNGRGRSMRLTPAGEAALPKRRCPHCKKPLF